MPKIVIAYGVSAGLITSLLVVLKDYEFYLEGQYTFAAVLGYLSILIPPFIMFFAIRSYRENILEGAIGWTRAVIFGLYVWVCASVLYVVGIKLFSSILMPDFWSQSLDRSIDALRHEGMSDRAILEAMKKRGFDYSHPNYFLWGWAWPFIKIFSFGLVITPVCAFLLRRKVNLSTPRLLRD